MIKLHQFALATIIGLSTPMIHSIVDPIPAIAQPQKLSGVFGDNKWIVSIFFERNAYRYNATKIGDKTGIDLAGATINTTRDRKTYTWNNGGTRYQAVWQQKDPDFIRVRVFSPRGDEIFNRLLKRQDEGC
jgi:hypothetical protein